MSPIQHHVLSCSLQEDKHITKPPTLREIKCTSHLTSPYSMGSPADWKTIQPITRCRFPRKKVSLETSDKTLMPWQPLRSGCILTKPDIGDSMGGMVKAVCKGPLSPAWAGEVIPLPMPIGSLRKVMARLAAVTAAFTITLCASHILLSLPQSSLAAVRGWKWLPASLEPLVLWPGGPCQMKARLPAARTLQESRGADSQGTALAWSGARGESRVSSQYHGFSSNCFPSTSLVCSHKMGKPHAQSDGDTKTETNSLSDRAMLDKRPPKQPGHWP